MPWGGELEEKSSIESPIGVIVRAGKSNQNNMKIVLICRELKDKMRNLTFDKDSIKMVIGF